MARHALIEAPATGLYPIIDPVGRHPHQDLTDLGGSAMIATMDADLFADNAEYFERTGAPVLAAEAQAKAEAAYDEVRETLEEVRAQIMQAPDSDIAEDYLRPFLAKSFARARGQGAKHSTMLRWLADAENGATESQLCDFLVDHLRHLARQRQNPEILKTIELARADYITKVEKAVEARHYDPYALKTLTKVRKAQILIGDVWDTRIIGRKGYRLWGQDFVVVGQHVYGNEADHDEMNETIMHELDHLQFPNRMTESHWRREARAEHNTQSLLHDQWEQYNPKARDNDGGVYGSERRLDYILMNYGRRQIHADVATRAHTSAINSKARARFEQEIAESWTPDMLEWVEARVDIHMDRLENEGYAINAAQGMATELVGQELWHFAQRMRGLGKHARIKNTALLRRAVFY